MRPEGITAAQRELKRMIRAQHRCMSKRGFDEKEDAWDAYLTHASKIYGKLRAACHGEPLDWTWWKKKMDERQEDELLLYIHKARNSDTHRLEETTIRLSAGVHTFNLPSYGVLVQNCVSDHLSPLPVRDKEGVVYNPPCRHKSRFIGYMDVVTIMWLAWRKRRQ